ncbi:protein ZGRF1 isoform X1 [Cygnus olor]|uniref:protein ZGRF1 isoform X1 n=1 Tax=Cygnus olor TaxID=8869 RepID=UPI001ADEADF8|nr:protein ZGRF1 isoform X1 [Cygnus olor]XP_040411899.1 protein ZGRF1 isoform X1 [Cygnus olor]
MSSQEFTVLYTHQKMKKSKTWQDGTLKIRTGGNKAILLDDKGQCLDSMFIKSQVNAGDNLESERYLITVEAVKVNEKPCEDQPRKAEIIEVNRNGVKPGILPSRHLSVGLKRKFTGFQGPRQVEKKTPTMEDGENPATSSISKQCQGIFPAKFCITSPLFSTIGEKNAETNLSTDFHEDALTKNNRDHGSFSLVSPQFLDTCNEIEKRSSDQSLVKPESPLITGHTKSSGQTTGHGAVSQNIRSTAQIIALLKSKTTQACREEATPEVTKCLSRFQAPENTNSLCNPKSTTLPAFSGNSDKRLAQNIQNLYFTKETVNAKKEWNAEMLLIACDKEVTGQRRGEKANNLSQHLRDSCNTNSSFLSESTINRLHESQFVPSCSASPTIFETHLSPHREHLVTNGLQENSSVKSKSHLQPQQSSEREHRDLGVSGDITLTEIGIVKEELSTCEKDCGQDEQIMQVNFNLLEAFDFNDTDDGDQCERNMKELLEEDVLSKSPDSLGGDVAQNTALRLHSCCEKEEIKYSTFGRENDGNTCAAGIPLQFCDNNVRERERIVEDSANQTQITAEFLDERNYLIEMNENQLSVEDMNNKDDLGGCTVNTANGMPGIKNKHSDLLPDDTNVIECHPESGMFENTESVSCITTSRIISAVEKRTEEDVMQLGRTKSPDNDLEHFWGTKSDDTKPGSPLLALSQQSDPCCGPFQYIAEDHQNVFGISCKEDTLVSRSAIYPLGKGHSAPEEAEIGETEFENVESINALHEACKGERIGMDCLKCTAIAENSSDLPDLVNNIALLRALSQHSTALESLQKMEENDSMLYEAETSKEIFEPLVTDEAIKEFTEMPYSESIEASSCSCIDSSGILQPNCVDSLLQQTELYIPPIALGQRDPRTSDCQPKPVEFQGHQIKGSAASEIMLRNPCLQLGWQQYPDNMQFEAERFLSPPVSSNYVLSDFSQSPGSGRLHKDDTNFIGEENFQKKSNFIKESIVDLSPLALNAHSEVPLWIMSGSPSCSNLGQTQWSSWEADKMISSVQLTSSVSPASGSKETVRDIQTLLIHRNLPSDSELSENVFTWEKHSYPEECSPTRLKPTVKTRTPLVTVPGTEKIPNVEFFLTDSEKSQQSSGSSVVSFSSKSAAFPISASGPEDRNYEASVFGEYMEDRQRESVQPVFPNVTSLCRQSKWLKYQSSTQCDLITQNSDDVEVTDGICPESILGMLLGDTGESQSSAVNENAPGSAPLQTAKSMLGKCSAKSSSQDLISERKLLSLRLSQAPLGEPTQKVLSHLSCHTVTGDVQEITVSELSFPNMDKVKYANLPKRRIAIPIVFQSHVHYKQIFKAALTEHLNIMLFELSQRLHNALSKVDVSFYTSLKDGQSESKESGVLLCSHMRPAKLVTVKKEGQNKGRLFYACDAPRAERCSFFKWIEEVNPAQIKSRPSVVLHDIKSIGTYLRSQKISLFEGCQLLVRKAYGIQTQRCSKFKKFMNVHAKFDGDSKNKLYLKLSRKEHYSVYSKDDIWVVSKTLNFDPLDTFIACSAFFGPSSNNEVELLPLKGYYPSNWQSNISVHALLVCNASGELTSLRNMEEYFNPSTLPLIPYLLKMNLDSEKPAKRVNKRKFTPPAMSLERTMMHGPVSTEVAMGLAEKMIETFSLNPDQATSLVQIAQMMTSRENIKPVEEHQIFPITIIRGVFGAGKSYLLSVVILFLVQLFESSEAEEGPRPAPWKLLIASSTNVAVDRILLGLLDLGFEDFIRVGSIRKITKAILPYSLHAGSGNENEQLKELLALLKEDLTPIEKIYVRKSIEQHKLGTNKTILQQVKVVGATCAACPFPCLNNLKFPVVMLDECSQMTEPASLLPIARFQCEKLVLVGDPKQLPPTIQGSESVHEKGLEQTLFDRLCLMGHKTIPLRTQYRCHPAISAIANELFYEGNLIDGVSEKERSPLLDWLPTLCFYSANGMEQPERDNSFYNMAEAHFTVKLIQSLTASGIEGSVIGVITLYKSQMCKIQNLLNSVHSEAFEIKAVQVSTVDAFQGAEKEIIVLSCVRTRQMGFIDSEKRMNVALTRAKRHLLIVGNLACLSKNRLWGRVIHHCKEWENGLQHVSQCEQQLNNILKCYLEEKEKEEKSKKKEK